MPPPSLRHLDAPASSVGSGSSSLRGRRNRAGRPLLNRLNTATGPFPRPLKPGSLSPDSLLSVFCSSDSSTPSLQWEATVRVPAPIQLQSSASVQSPVIPGRRSRWDDLEASVCALDASDNQGAFGDSAYDLFRLLESEILATRKTYRKFLQYRGLMAQLLIDTLQWILRFHPSLDGGKRRQFMQALIRLAKRAKMLPRSYLLEGVSIGEVMFQTTSVDIYRGVYGQRQVCLKKYRGCTQSRSQPADGQDLDRMTEMSIREAIVWANCDHPGLLPFEGTLLADSDPERVYLVSPFLEFGTVVSYLVANPDVDRRLLVRDILRAVTYLHSNSIVHGDIKGDNVLADATGRAVLADLGLSRLSDVELLTWMSVHTSSPSLGTLPWLAPEILGQIRAQQPVCPTTASDVYALGCLIYEIFAGNAPFHEISRGYHYVSAHYRITTEVLHGRRPSKPTPNSPPYLHHGLSEDIWAVMEECWDRDVKARPTVQQLLKKPCFVNLADHRPILEDS